MEKKENRWKWKSKLPEIEIFITPKESERQESEGIKKDD